MFKKPISIVFLIYAILFIAVFGRAFSVASIERHEVRDGNFVNNLDWVLTLNGENEGLVSLPYDVYATESFSMRVEKEIALPNDDNIFLAIRASQHYMRILWNEDVIYEYGNPENYPVGTSLGSAWNFVPLNIGEPEEEGILAIEFLTDSSFYGKYINSIRIGSLPEIYYFIFMDKFLGLFGSLLMITIGVIGILCGIYLNKKLNGKTLIYLGLFSIDIGIWSLCESMFLDIIFPNPSVLIVLSCLSLMASPLFFIALLRDLFQMEKGKLYATIFHITLLNSIICMALHLFGITSLQVSITSSHILIGVDLLVMAALIFKKIKSGVDREYTLFFIGAVIVSVFSLADILLYQYAIRTNNFQHFQYGNLFRISFMIFIAILVAESIKQIFVAFVSSYQSDVYKQMLNTDFMTNLNSRYAFERDMKTWQNSGQLNENFFMMVLDMNGLKEINDTLGHHAGDAAIIETANAISDALFSYGKCYRIGGDEFVAILPQVDEKLVEKLEKDIKSRLTGEDGKTRIAIGTGYFEVDSDESAHAMFSRIDSKMYVDKRITKGERRRNSSSRSDDRQNLPSKEDSSKADRRK